MATSVRDDLGGPARALDRTLRVVEDFTHSLRQKLLARRVAHTAPPDHWVPTAGDDAGISADDLRRHAGEVRRRQPG